MKDNGYSPVILSAQNISKTFGQTTALKDASLEIRTGEIVAVMGASGSGKSTLLHCLAGILNPDSGAISFQGTRIDSLSDEKRTTLRRQKFGFVFQFGQLVPELTALENVALPLMLDGRPRVKAFRQAAQWLERVDLAQSATHRPGELSGGQAQRVALARSLVTGPSVLFADEPTGALDSLNSERVMELLTEAAHEHQVTLVLVTHDPRIAAYADRDITVQDGVVQGASAV